MSNRRRIAFASGKGGVGKTTLAASLAVALAKKKINTAYVDCDVEAPNGFLFLKPDFSHFQTVTVPVATVDLEKCTACGICVDACQFNALALAGGRLLVFDSLCHGCGSCIRLCPEGALTEKQYPVGQLSWGIGRENLLCLQGKLNISEPMAAPVVHQLKQVADQQPGQVFIYDAPPGASCTVVETLQSMDFVYLVTEPTPFGLHDLKQILGVTKALEIPFAVIINRDGIGDDKLNQFLTQEKIPTALKIPYDDQIAKTVASGGTLLDAYPDDPYQLGNLYSDAAWERVGT
jgi:MinD superfamily P-loop ATPase